MNHENKEQAAEKWAYDWGNHYGYNSRTDDLEDGFIAGASWREQRANKGFEGAFTELVLKKWHIEEDMLEAVEYSAREIWQASQLSSAKLLAEKDAEIERLRSIKSHQSDLIDIKSRELREVKELIKEMREDIHTLYMNTRANYISPEQKEKTKEVIRKHKLSIKPPLGEE